MTKEPLFFKDYREMRKYFRAGAVFEEPERIAPVEEPKEEPKEEVQAEPQEEVRDEVPAKRTRKSRAKRNADKE